MNAEIDRAETPGVLKRIRQWLVDWLLDDVHIRNVHFGEESITLSPTGVGDVVRWTGSGLPAQQLGDLGMNTTTGKPSYYGAFGLGVDDLAGMNDLDSLAFAEFVVAKDYIGNAETIGYVGNLAASAIEGLSPAADDAYVVTVADGAGALSSANVGDVWEWSGSAWVQIVVGTGGNVPANTNLIANRTTPLISPLTDGTDERSIFVFNGTGLVPASTVTPTRGDTVAFANNGGREQGNVRWYDPEGPNLGWNSLQNDVGGFTPAGTRLAVAGATATLIYPALGRPTQIAEFSGASQVPAFTVRTTGDVVAIKDHAGAYFNGNTLWQKSGIPSLNWVPVAGDPDFLPFIKDRTPKTTTFTATIGETHVVDLTGGGFTANLPSVTVKPGRIAFHVQGTGGQLTLDPFSAQQIEGKSTIKLQQGHNTIENDGVQWHLVQKTGRFNERLDPVQITADQNDYNPTDWGRSVTHLFIDSDASRTITGFEENGFVDMDMVMVVNDGSNNIVIAHDSASSTVNNRVLIEGGQSIVLRPNGVTRLIRDGTVNKWRLCHMEGSVSSDPNGIALAFTTTGAGNLSTTENLAGPVDCLNYKYVTFWLEITNHDTGPPTEFTYAVRWSEDLVTADSQKTESITTGVGTLTDYTALDDISGKTPTYVRQFTVPTLGRRYCFFEVKTDAGTATGTLKYQRGA